MQSTKIRSQCAVIPLLLAWTLAGSGCKRSPTEERAAREKALRAKRVQAARQARKPPAPPAPPQVVYVPGPTTKPAPPATPPATSPTAPGPPAWATTATGATGPVPTTPLNKLRRRTRLLHSSLSFQGEGRRGTAETVNYESWGLNLHAHYKRALKAGGWKKVGTFSSGERTRCGGDWGGYYEKGPLRMRFHLCGPEAVHGFERGQLRQLPALLSVTITTYGFHPRQILGRDYKRRTNSPQHGKQRP